MRRGCDGVKVTRSTEKEQSVWNWQYGKGPTECFIWFRGNGLSKDDKRNVEKKRREVLPGHERMRNKLTSQCTVQRTETGRAAAIGLGIHSMWWNSVFSVAFSIGGLFANQSENWMDWASKMLYWFTEGYIKKSAKLLENFSENIFWRYFGILSWGYEKGKRTTVWEPDLWIQNWAARSQIFFVIFLIAQITTEFLTNVLTIIILRLLKGYCRESVCSLWDIRQNERNVAGQRRCERDTPTMFFPG